MEKTEIKNGSEIYDTVRELLRLFGADSVQTVEFTDSSHGDSDIRHNYLIDRKYVLRINSAPVMTDGRLEELNRLIERYREFGMHAPKFLKAKDGRFIVERDGNICYLSEYLDETVADDVKDVAVIENQPKMEGRNMHMLIAPLPATAKKKKDSKNDEGKDN